MGRSEKYRPCYSAGQISACISNQAIDGAGNLTGSDQSGIVCAPLADLNNCCSWFPHRAFAGAVQTCQFSGGFGSQIIVNSRQPHAVAGRCPSCQSRQFGRNRGIDRRCRLFQEIRAIWLARGCGRRRLAMLGIRPRHALTRLHQPASSAARFPGAVFSADYLA